MTVRKIRNLGSLAPRTFGPTVALVGGAMLAMLSFSSAPAYAAECGEVVIAEMNWASAGLAANVDKLILEDGYGCQTSLISGDTLPTFASMSEKAQPDVAPEMWVNLIKQPLDEAVAAGKLVNTVKTLKDGGVEGWWIPKYLAEANPDIKSVADAFKHPELFPAPEDSSKGAVYGCPAGWSCQLATANIFKAFDGEAKGFTLVDTGSAAGLDGSLANAYEKQTGWLGYYWAPTALLGKYDMVMLPFGVDHDAAEWTRCTSVDDCPDPKVNSWPKGDVFTTVTSAFSKRNPVAMDYFQKRSWSNDVVNKILAWMTENQATGADGAAYFLKEFPDVWAEWVTPEAAEKIKASL